MIFKYFTNVRYMQYVAAFSASLAIGSHMVYLTWLSPTLPKFHSNESPLGYPASSTETSWIASINSLGSVSSCLFAGLIIRKIGPRKALLLSSIIMTVPWFTIMFAKSIWVIYISRFIGGSTTGLIIISVIMYNSEIAEQKIRGKVTNTYNIVKLLSQFIVLTAGPFVSYTVLCMICAVFPILCCCSMYFMPESPYHLLKTGDREGAKNSLIVLSKRNEAETSINAKLKDIESTIEKDMVNKSSVMEFVKNPLYRRSLLIMTAVKVFSLMSGSVALDSYMQSIVQSSHSVISPEISSIIFGVIQVPAAFVTNQLVDKLGRKPLLFISSLGCAVALLSEGLYFYVQDSQHGNLEYISWIPTAGIVLFFLMAPLGLTSLPYVLMGELFPVNIKESAITLMTFFGSIMSFGVAKLFEPISEMWGMYTAFWIFAGFCTTSCLFTIIFLPETKGKSFGDIQIKLNRNRFIDDGQKPKEPEKY